MLNALKQKLERNKLLAFAIAGIYYLLVVFPHEWVGKKVEKYLDIPLGRDNYNLLILLLSVLLILTVGTYSVKGLGQLPDKTRKFLLWLFTLLLACLIAAFNTIIVINIELIHVVQYAVMALLLFPILNNFRETLFWTTVLGVCDELYQYLVIAADKANYYDFNDVVINLLGASLGLLILRSRDVKAHVNYSKWIDSPASLAMLFGSVFLITGLLTGWISIWPSDSEEEGFVLFEFVKQKESGFWTSLPPNVKFHVMRPVEGFITVLILFNVFKNIGYKFATDEEKKNLSHG
jgi:hypothetical protein